MVLIRSMSRTVGSGCCRSPASAWRLGAVARPHRLGSWVRPPLASAWRWVPSLACFGLALAPVACSFAPEPEVPAPVADIPDAFASGVATDEGDAASPDAAGRSHGTHDAVEWWRAFQDPALDAVVDSALASNFDLAEAVARVQQARAQAGVARAALFPSVQVSASGTDQDTPANAGIGAQFRTLALGALGSGVDASSFPSLDRLAFTTYSVSADFAYEIDFWGRARNDARAAGSDYLASEADFHAARIGMLAETISTYFEIVALRRQTALARETVSVLLEREAHAETRYHRGLATSFELYQVRRDLTDAQAGLPQLETGLASAEGRLAALLGRYRGDLRAILPDTLSPVHSSDPVPAGVPADLLVQRPDVLAARLRLDAARYRVGARRADLLPTLSLAGSIGLQSAEADGLFDVDQWFRNLVANLVAPIFQGGRLKSNLAGAHARLGQAAAVYGRTVVTAVQEVETALARLENEGRRRDFLASNLEEARATTELQARRYASGIGDYGSYLDALRGRLNVESGLVGARRDLALARLGVHRALGGAWTAGDLDAAQGDLDGAQGDPDGAQSDPGGAQGNSDAARGNPSGAQGGDS